MAIPLELLIIEDSENDTLLLLHELKKGGYHPTYTRVETAQAMEEALSRQRWDLVLSDYTMPDFSAPAALELLKNSGIDIPFIIVSGSIGEDRAVAAMKAGAHDYVMKENLARLLPVIARELGESERRESTRRAQSRTAAEHDITRTLSGSHTLHEAAPIILRRVCETLEWELGALWQVDVQTDLLRCAAVWHRSPAGEAFKENSLRMTFQQGTGLPGRVWSSGAISFNDITNESSFQRAESARQGGLHAAFGFPIRSGDKTLGVLEFFNNKIALPDDTILAMIAAISGQIAQFIERRQAEEALLASEKRSRALIEKSSDAIGLIDPEGVILYASPSTSRILGYSLDAFVGKSAFDLIHPEDIEYTKALFHELLQSPNKSVMGQYRMLHREGAWRCMEGIATNLLDEPSVQAIVVNYRDVSERVWVQEAFERVSLQNELILNAAGDGICGIDIKGKATFVNPAAAKMLGYQVSEMMGQSLHDLIHPPSLRIGTCLPHRCSVNVTLKKGTASPQRNGLFWKKSGSSFPVEYVVTPIQEHGRPTGAVIVFKDFSERKKVEEALANEKERLSVTLRSIGDGVIATDTQGKILLMNNAAEKLTGWSQEEGTGRPFTEVFHTVDVKTRYRCEDIVQAVLKIGGTVEVVSDTALIARDETERPIAETAAPIRDKEGNIIGVISVFHDMTDKKKMEEELLKGIKLDAVGLLAGGIAHDFNNILTAIIGNISLAKMYADQKELLMERLAQAEKVSVRAKDLAQQLLTFSQGGAPTKTPTSIAGLLKSTVPYSLRGSNIRSDFFIQDDLWPIEVDQGQIRQVINNLMINAVHAMPEGGTIHISAENISIENEIALALKKGRYIRLKIKDAGAGISKENLPKIFDPYFTTKQKGNGLGLTSSYSIIKQHHGHITAESQVGAGTTFNVYLPAFPGTIPPGQDDAPCGGRGRILIMDDYDDVREVAEKMLKVIGYEVSLVQNGTEALKSYQEAKEAGRAFDAVIMDLTIPGDAGGKETIQRLLTFDPQVKAIVSSGFSNDPIMSTFKKHGFSGVVTKPYKMEELADVLQTLLKQPVQTGLPVNPGH